MTNFILHMLTILYLSSRCNGSYFVERCDSDTLKLCGMDGAAMDYAVHGHAIAHIKFAQFENDCNVLMRHPEENVLLVSWPLNYQIPHLPREKVYVHFEINHSYFDGLHKAVNCLNQHAICKLFPSEQSLRNKTIATPLTQKEKCAIKPLEPDTEYQMNALCRMISSNPRVPFLVLGPFGTGKTHLLAAAASVLVCDPKSRVLVCTYQHQCANSIYDILFKKYTQRVMRLVPSETIAEYVKCGKSGIMLMRDVTPADIAKKSVTITTFLTATNLHQKEIKHRQNLHFTHILIDEGAQAREPELYGALAIAKEDTKIVIVGDHKQVKDSRE